MKVPSDEHLSGRSSRLRRAIAGLSPLVRRRPWTIAAIVGISVVAGAVEAGVLALVSFIAAAMSTTGERSFAIGPFESAAPISLLLIFAGLLAIGRLFLQIALAKIPARLSGQLQTELRTRLFDAFLMTTWAHKASESEGHLQELMGGQMTQASAAIWHVANGISAAVMFLALAVSAFLLSAPVALGIMGTAAVLFVCLRPLSKRMRRRSAATSSALVSQATSIAESVRMAEEVQVFGVTAWERSRVISLVRSLEGHFVQTRFLSRIVPAVYQGVLIVLIVASLAILYAIGTEANRLAALGAVVLLLVRASNYGQAIQVAYQGVGESLPYIERVAHATNQYLENVRNPGHHALDSAQTIDFQSVSFEYRPESLVLQDVSFSIRAGEAIGVVGPSGAGKSTLVQLLLRLRDPVAGNYLVNGISAKEVDDLTWHRKVSYLPQEPHLLNATVAENIRFFRDWVEDDAIERAARLAHVHHDIATWPDGYLAVVGHRANSLSGGQIQRLCLARALAGAPQVLILDEPTSSLDLHSEQLIQESLQGLRGTLTLIVVAHRLTTLSLCDRVMVIRDGRLEAFAPPVPLYNSNDYYRRAVDLAGAGKPL